MGSEVGPWLWLCLFGLTPGCFCGSVTGCSCQGSEPRASRLCVWQSTLLTKQSPSPDFFLKDSAKSGKETREGWTREATETGQKSVPGTWEQALTAGGAGLGGQLILAFLFFFLTATPEELCRDCSLPPHTMFLSYRDSEEKSLEVWRILTDPSLLSLLSLPLTATLKSSFDPHHRSQPSYDRPSFLPPGPGLMLRQKSIGMSLRTGYGPGA